MSADTPAGFAAAGSDPGSVSRMGQASFRVNSPTVVSETVDREVVMIHLDTGNYYSLRSTGALIWDALERGATVESITSALGATSHNGSDVGAVVGSFVDELMTEELIVPADRSGTRVPPRRSSSLPTRSNRRCSRSTPICSTSSCWIRCTRSTRQRDGHDRAMTHDAATADVDVAVAQLDSVLNDARSAFARAVSAVGVIESVRRDRRRPGSHPLRR